MAEYNNLQDDLTEAFRNFRVNSGQNPNPPEEVNTLIMPRNMALANNDDTELQQRIRRYRQVVPDIPKMPAKFELLSDLNPGLSVMSTDFRDDKFVKEGIIKLVHLSTEETVNLGRYVIPMLRSGFSQSGVGALFVLAYQLRNPGDPDSFVFPEVEEDILDKDCADLPDNVLATVGENIPMPQIANIESEATAYAFIAASTLRMFTKSEDNYIKAFNHILLGFQRFYGYPIPITPGIPTLEALKTITHFFSHNHRMQMTLYRILYIGGTAPVKNLRTFLYELYLANTGIHIISIFVKLCGVLNCSPAMLLCVINVKEFENQIEALVAMSELILNSDQAYSHKMWRFGRLFDETFMSALQTKSCPKLTYILASALKSESAKTNADILKIAQLEDVSPEQRVVCDEVGLMIVKMIRKANIEESSSHAFDIQCFTRRAVVTLWGHL